MNNLFSRREALKAAMVSPLFSQGNLPPAAPGLPPDLPEGVRAVIRNALQQAPESLNTDWFGTTLLQGLLEWHRRGLAEVKPFATSWLGGHLKSGTVSRFSGAKSRQVVAGGIHITTYAGHFGLAFPCHEMALQFQDERAGRVCIEVGKMVLHQVARNRLGMVEHDDSGEFAIPDTCYFAVRALLSAASLDRVSDQALREQAVYQLRIYVDTFLDRDKGLAKTVLLRDGLGKTYWTRASGWLLWAITSVLRFLPGTDPSVPRFRDDLGTLAAGMARVQDLSGGFRVLMDDPETPLETTGTAMFACGVHEGIRNGWLAASYRPTVERAWEFVKGNITEDGQVRNAYTGWAIPAENREMSMDEHKMGWIPGFILIVANEMTTA